MVLGAMAWPGSLLAIAADEKISLWQDVGYQTVGVVIVLGSLGFLAMVLTIMGHFLRPRRAETGATPPRTLPLAEPETVSPAVRAVIVAAVYETLGPGHRVVDIESPLSAQQIAWSMEGRRQIFSSHRVR